MDGSRILLLISMLLGLGSPADGSSAAAPAVPAGDVILEPCTLDGVPPPAECGTYRVREDRDRDGGRSIELRIVRLGPTGSTPAADPLFVILGGPGSSATAAAAGIARQFGAVRAERALVLVDQRGTGGSHPLECDLYPGEGVARLVGDLFPVSVVRRCAESLQATADLTQYHTIRAVEDLEEVRRGLGYDRVNLYGVSYGTRVVLDFLRRYPDAVRSAVLHGVSGPDQLGRFVRAPNAQRALDGVLGECLASEQCRAAFPELRERAGLVFDRLRREPAMVEVLDPWTGAPTRVPLTADLAAEAVRYMLYSPRTAGLVPLVLHEAGGGNLEAVAEFAVFGRQHIVNSGGNGMYLSITCSEDLGVGDPSLGARQARGTFWSDYTERQLLSACWGWPRAAVPATYRETVVFTGPVLVISGQWDPATPASQGAEAATALPNSRHIVVPHGGHDFEGLENGGCVHEVLASFVHEPRPRELDATCIATIARPAFATEPLPMRPVPIERASLARLEGRYASQEIGLSTTVRLSGDRLRLLLPGGVELPLVAVAPDRFRSAGLLGTYFRFTREASGGGALILEQIGSPPLRLARVPGEP
jgi:pimeloyl-ACP methyl ester carboxylesterase